MDFDCSMWSFQTYLKGTATLMISTFYNKEVFKTGILIPFSSKSGENGEVMGVKKFNMTDIERPF